MLDQLPHQISEGSHALYKCPLSAEAKAGRHRERGKKEKKKEKKRKKESAL